MMIKNISHNDKDTIKEINQIVGKPFSLVERFKQGGIGSPRFLVTEASGKMHALLFTGNSSPFASVELRPSGILVGFKSRLETYVWVIPYNILTLFKSEDSLAVYAREDFLRLKIQDNFSSQNSFIQKLLSMKARYSEISAPPFE